MCKDKTNYDNMRNLDYWCKQSASDCASLVAMHSTAEVAPASIGSGINDGDALAITLLPLMPAAAAAATSAACAAATSASAAASRAAALWRACADAFPLGCSCVAAELGRRCSCIAGAMHLHCNVVAAAV